MAKNRHHAKEHQCDKQYLRRLKMADKQISNPGDEYQDRQLDRVIGAVERYEAGHRSKTAQTRILRHANFFLVSKLGQIVVGPGDMHHVVQSLVVQDDDRQ